MRPDTIMIWRLARSTPRQDKKELPRIVPPDNIAMPALTVLVLI